MKVVLLDTVHEALPKGLKEIGFELQEAYTQTGKKLQAILAAADGLIVRSRIPINHQVFEWSPNLKFIGRVGAGMENIDVDMATSRKVALFNAPEGNRTAVGEHALGMLLMLLNRLKIADNEVRQGVWLRAENRGVELEGKTIGIIGYGHMGSAFAEKLQGFGCAVLAYDKYKTGFASKWVKEVSLATLQQQADIVSLHIPQTEETIGMVNTAFLENFAKPIYLINTARGKIVNTEALVEALKNKKVSGACLDVLEYEKSSFENMFSRSVEHSKVQKIPQAFQYLLKAPQVLLSPHIAGWTHESNRKMAEVIVEKIKQWKNERSI